MGKLDVQGLRETIQGSVILKGDPGYESVGPALFSPGEPAMVIQPATSQDVVVALKYAADHGLELAVRSGGHSTAGFSTNNGGLVIDMSRMNAIEVLDRESGLVRLGSGAKWGDVATRLAEEGLGMSSGDTKTVGVGGLTLGGGIGWMVRKHGLTIDSLVAAEVVLANGEVLRASESDHPDLFWAIRGGGGNFGIVTSFEFRAHPVGDVHAGAIMFAWENPRDLIAGWARAMQSAPVDLTTVLMVMPPMEANPPGAMLTVCFAGENESDANAALEPLRAIGKVLHDTVARKEYAAVLEDAHAPEGVKVIVKSGFLKTMSDAILDTLVDVAGKPGSPFVILRSMGGAVSWIPVEKTAFPVRDAEAMIMAPVFVSPNATEEEQAKALEPWHRIAEHITGMYCNFLSDPDEACSDIYPPETLARLREVKKTYDPDTVFHSNYTISPAS